MEDYTIRRFLPGDEHSLARIMRAAIEQIGPRGYTQEQVEAWAANATQAELFLDRAGRGDVVILAQDSQGEPVAYCLIETNGHIDHIYCDPGHAGRGLARGLLKEVDRVAREFALVRLFTEASEIARPTFERDGFVLTEKREFTINGVAIHNYAMEKLLG